ncbi:hypothetical protein ACVGWN_00265, partial [Enterobacter hormaechei]
LIAWVGFLYVFGFFRWGVGGLAGPGRVFAFDKFPPVVWGTGGGMVRLFFWDKFFDKGIYFCGVGDPDYRP